MVNDEFRAGLALLAKISEVDSRTDSELTPFSEVILAAGVEHTETILAALATHEAAVQ